MILLGLKAAAGTNVRAHLQIACVRPLGMVTRLRRLVLTIHFLKGFSQQLLISVNI